MIDVGIHGSTGRVGKLLIENLEKESEAKPYMLHAIEEFTFPLPNGVKITEDYEELFKNSDVVIDFTIAFATEILLEEAIKNPTPLVIGTTGLNEHQQNLLKEASELMPILYSTNMSMGVAVLNRLVALASKSLSDFDIEIVEQTTDFKKMLQVVQHDSRRIRSKA